MNFTCVAPDDICLDVRHRFSTDYFGTEEAELQLKACATMEDCKRKGHETCREAKGKCRYTCCQHDLCNDDSLARSLDALKCFHCQGSNESDVFNHSTPPKESFTSGQCDEQQRETFCPSDYKCARVLRLFRPYNDTTIEVERRSCISDEESSALQSICNGTEHKLANGTSWCQYYLCERDLCNLASCVHLASFSVIAFSIMFGMMR